MDNNSLYITISVILAQYMMDTAHTALTEATTN